MEISSTAFANNEQIPSEYTCDGRNISPPLSFSQIPVEAMSLVLTVEDLDAPHKNFTHWLLYNLSSATLQILENETPSEALQGINDFGNIGYGGPCPPEGTHRYLFRLFALNSMLSLEEGATKQQILDEIQGKIIESTEIVGLYK